MKKLIAPILFLMVITACHSQSGNQEKSNKEKKSTSEHVGGPCEGCEAVHEYGDKKLTSIDTLPDFHEEDQQLKITGTIYQRDGKTPANDVILYIYHTNKSGIYPTNGDETGWEKRHGYIRGWIKTDQNGKYTFYTFRPGAYPGRTGPAHIHAIVKEPGINEYYLSDYLFADDPLLPKESQKSVFRGGSGVLTPKKEGSIWVAERDITLGLNVPGYE